MELHACILLLPLLSWCSLLGSDAFVISTVANSTTGKRPGMEATNPRRQQTHTPHSDDIVVTSKPEQQTDSVSDFSGPAGISSNLCRKALDRSDASNTRVSSKFLQLVTSITDSIVNLFDFDWKTLKSCNTSDNYEETYAQKLNREFLESISTRNYIDLDGPYVPRFIKPTDIEPSVSQSLQIVNRKSTASNATVTVTDFEKQVTNNETWINYTEFDQQGTNFVVPNNPIDIYTNFAQQSVISSNTSDSSDQLLTIPINSKNLTTKTQSLDQEASSDIVYFYRQPNKKLDRGPDSEYVVVNFTNFEYQIDKSSNTNKPAITSQPHDSEVITATNSSDYVEIITICAEKRVNSSVNNVTEIISTTFNQKVCNSSDSSEIEINSTALPQQVVNSSDSSPLEILLAVPHQQEANSSESSVFQIISGVPPEIMAHSSDSSELETISTIPIQQVVNSSDSTEFEKSSTIPTQQVVNSSYSTEFDMITTVSPQHVANSPESSEFEIITTVSPQQVNNSSYYSLFEITPTEPPQKVANNSTDSIEFVVFYTIPPQQVTNSSDSSVFEIISTVPPQQVVKLSESNELEIITTVPQRVVNSSDSSLFEITSTELPQQLANSSGPNAFEIKFREDDPEIIAQPETNVPEVTDQFDPEIDAIVEYFIPTTVPTGSVQHGVDFSHPTIPTGSAEPASGHVDDNSELDSDETVEVSEDDITSAIFLFNDRFAGVARAAIVAPRRRRNRDKSSRVVAGKLRIRA